MNILFLAPSYNNLYLPILKAMQEAGHNVTYVEDIEFKHSPYYRGKGNKSLVKRLLKFVYYKILNAEKRYWKSKIKQNPSLSHNFDLLFCIQGISFCSLLLIHLKKYNPNIKTALYVWDSCSYYDYSIKFHYFDKVMTFDLLDSLQYNIDFLPFYWTKNQKLSNKYDISIVGTDHDGRLGIVEKIAKQLENKNINFYFRIYSNKNVNSKYTTKELLPVETVEEIISESACILDTDRDSQTGTTPRVIWALALGKKIISTNQNLRKMPFYNDKQFCIIDRNNPIVDSAFILDKVSFPSNEYVAKLHIDVWINNFVKF